MKNLTGDEQMTYNTLLMDIRTGSTNNRTFHLARLREFVEVMLLAQYGYETSESIEECLSNST